jgi:hypothetical protein
LEKEIYPELKNNYLKVMKKKLKRDGKKEKIKVTL